MGDYSRRGRISSVTFEFCAEGLWDCFVTRYHGSAEYSRRWYRHISLASHKRAKAVLFRLTMRNDCIRSESYSLE